jgi:hypothetical protein
VASTGTGRGFQNDPRRDPKWILFAFLVIPGAICSATGLPSAADQPEINVKSNLCSEKCGIPKNLDSDNMHL